MVCRNLAHLFPGELTEYLAGGDAIAIAGCGSVEQHGPHQLLGTDTYFTQIFMDYAAEGCGGLTVPIMPFSWIGGLRQWPGTIDIRSRNQGAYLESMCAGLVEMGFKRIVLVNGHGGGREITFSAARRAFKQTGVPVFAIYASNYWFAHPEAQAIWAAHGVTDHAAYEPSMAAAGMIHIGRRDLADALLANAQEELERGGEYAESTLPPTFRRASALGGLSHFYWEERRHSRPSRQINPEAGLAVARLAGKLLAAQIKEYATYADSILP
jgi:creatinine amidohydrolase/Fe(II)-dependent formamide hydrolase-like protein